MTFVSVIAGARSRRIGSASARPTSAVVGGDARGWLQAQIGPADAPRGAGLLDTRQALALVAAEREARRQANEPAARE